MVGFVQTGVGFLEILRYESSLLSTAPPALYGVAQIASSGDVTVGNVWAINFGI